MSDFRLQTDIPSCALRPWRREDKSSLVRYANSREIWRNLTGMFPNPYTENDAEKWFSIVASPGRSVHLAIEYEGEAIGGIGVIAGEDVNLYTGHFGYWVGESLWGKGIATASVKTFATYALSLSQFARLEARVYAWNPASMRVLEKVGFIREGVHERSIYKDGQIIDSVIYAKVR